MKYISILLLVIVVVILSGQPVAAKDNFDYIPQSCDTLRDNKELYPICTLAEKFQLHMSTAVTVFFVSHVAVAAKKCSFTLTEAFFTAQNSLFSKGDTTQRAYLFRMRSLEDMVVNQEEWCSWEYKLLGPECTRDTHGSRCQFVE